jgi:hypothetical protein
MLAGFGVGGVSVCSNHKRTVGALVSQVQEGKSVDVALSKTLTLQLSRTLSTQRIEVLIKEREALWRKVLRLKTLNYESLEANQESTQERMVPGLHEQHQLKPCRMPRVYWHIWNDSNECILRW